MMCGVKEAKQAVIPNIKCDVFELIMRYIFFIPFSCFYNIKIGPLFDLVFVGTYRFIYTRTVHVKLDDAPDLLKASDQYLLEDLKLICERGMANIH